MAAVSPKFPELYPPWKVFFIELLFTFILMTCILHHIFPRLSIQSDTVLAVAGVVTCIYFCIRCVGDLTGGCFNPTVGFVNVTFVALARIGSDKPNFLPYLWAYFFGPLLGGVLAGIYCKYFAMPHVPHYYDAVLGNLKEDVSVKYSSVAFKGGKS